MEKGATHGKLTVSRETGLAFLEVLAATVTPTAEQREGKLDIEYFEDPSIPIAS